MKCKPMCRFLVLVVVAALAALLYPPAPGLASSILGSADSFAVLGTSTVTNDHSPPNSSTQIYGNLGVTPGTSITGFYPDGTVSGGTIHTNDGVAQLALTDAAAAYSTLSNPTLTPSTANLTGEDLGTVGVLTPGVYSFSSSAQLTGALTLNFAGQQNAAFIFQIDSTLTTASSSSVIVENGVSTDSIYWVVESSATLGSSTTFVGNILAKDSISLDSTATILCGRAIALDGAVTMIDNKISNNNSAQAFGSTQSDFGSYGFSGGPVPVPEPAIVLLLGFALGGVAAFKKGFKKA